ncbi:MAG: slipin family protein, partial [Cyanobacteria bacterium J06598_1]
RVTVFEYERGLKYVKGRFKQVLPPGQYRAGLFSDATIRKVDIRPQHITVPGQAVLTQDGVGLKVSLSAVYEVADPATAINGVANYQQALYLALQNALRDVVAALSMDDLMGARSQLSQQLLSAAATQLLPMGLRLISVDIKDLMLPGELKKLYAQVVQARQEGLAQLERARGESAALRNLANAAKLANDNPSLLQLRWLQALENSSGNTVSVNLLPRSDTKDAESR